VHSSSYCARPCRQTDGMVRSACLLSHAALMWALACRRLSPPSAPCSLTHHMADPHPMRSDDDTSRYGKAGRSCHASLWCHACMHVSRSHVCHPCLPACMHGRQHRQLDRPAQIHMRSLVRNEWLSVCTRRSFESAVFTTYNNTLTYRDYAWCLTPSKIYAP